MIRHRPAGSGHPFSVDTEQREPYFPVAGEPLVLGVRTSPGVTGVELELERHRPGESATSAVLPAEAVERTSRGQTIDGGHLASAQARLARSSGGWRVVLDDLVADERIRYRFAGTRADGTTERTRWFEAPVHAWRDAADSGVSTEASGGFERLVPGSVRVLTDGERVRRVAFALELAPTEHVTGFGERFDTVDHRGSEVDSVLFEQYKSQGAERKTYLPMPFAHVVGGEGWGFHVRTSRRVLFDVGAADRSRLAVEVETDAPLESAEPWVDVALYPGDPTSVLDAFLTEVGRPTELPSWVFRLWASGNEWNTQHEVMLQAELHREHDIPVGSIVIEAWSDESTFTVFRDARYQVAADGGPLTLDAFEFPAEGAWPDPKGMVDELHARDIRLHLWQIPLIKMRPHPAGQVRADAEAAVRENMLIREEAPDGTIRPYRNRGWWFPLGLMPDLTDERAARWWTEKRRYLVDEVGIDGFKTDGGEHAWGRELLYLDGTRGDEGNNRFPVAYAKAYGDLLERSGKAPVTFSRAGFTGSQAHGAFWAGDENSTWEAYRWSLNAGLSAAACGILYWGWDIAGFSGDVPDAELYLRASGTSVFAPIMQYHSEFNHHRLPSRDRTPWNIAERTGSAEVLPVFREFAQLRERLVPYLTAAAASSIRSGRPLMRPLYFDHGHDERVWEHPLHWYLGDDLLVSPVVQPSETTHEVLLPEGRWVDAWTGEESRGDRMLERPTPIGEVPVYVRAEAWPALGELFPGGA
ncbi:glycoside hydrolase family 31 protein [Herbiconiux ginsengi]|uniref:Alpha-glucosidase, glycosyl hydrolase family GH31 n=1 Tax=Herbiconiux ginsengi TaxID=381665 RepID=A0A1H3RYS1_9MICO|nr:TIM-barrel domain-containing protein [Herbiconiux ginsengi]SDZ30727.1 Alpha-glucosidase, glycosyl hydrolase family GH31 [Herbiconiux ginsengi]